MNQQKLKEWILKQKYFFLAPEYDGMTAWELAGIIIREGQDEKPGDTAENFLKEEVEVLKADEFKAEEENNLKDLVEHNDAQALKENENEKI